MKHIVNEIARSLAEVVALLRALPDWCLMAAMVAVNAGALVVLHLTIGAWASQ